MKTLSYHRKLLFILLGFSWTLVASCLIFLYSRESGLKENMVNTRLQDFNAMILSGLESGRELREVLSSEPCPFGSCRVSLIDSAGNVIYDSDRSIPPRDNHLSRPEVAEALRSGTAFTVRRLSETEDRDFFYSATARRGLVVRSAVPYSSPSLAEILDADNTFFLIMLAVTVALSAFTFIALRRLGKNISRLNSFARRAEKGERILADEQFPDDELGEISSHIVRLYARLQEALAERDRQHRQALHQEREKIRIKKQLTNNINHELKTPLAGIQVCLETLSTHPDISEEKRMEFLRRASDSAARLKALLDDVSAITRLDEGASAITMAPLDLAVSFRYVLDEMRLLPQAKGFTFITDIPAALPALANQALVESIMRNLVQNAISYSGGSKITFRLIGETPDHYRFSFADDGSGVAPEHLPHLFERFYRIDKGRSRKLGGTGLGLAIVKNAVMLHGGTIKADNVFPHGLGFEFTLAKTPPRPQ